MSTPSLIIPPQAAVVEAIRFSILAASFPIYLGSSFRSNLGARSPSHTQPSMAHEEEILGKAYDSRLMRRLLTYLRPYRWQVVIALLSILFKAFADVLGPYLTKVGIDRYLSPTTEATSGMWTCLSWRPLDGIWQMAAVYVGLLVFSLLLECV